jgi:hypothetical protein
MLVEFRSVISVNNFLLKLSAFFLLGILSTPVFAVDPPTVTVVANPNPNALAVAALPDKVADFSAAGPAQAYPGFETVARSGYGAQALAARVYRSRSNVQFQVTLAVFLSGSNAYALFSDPAPGQEPMDNVVKISRCDAGTACMQTGDFLSFFKGSDYVRVTVPNGDTAGALKLAHALADTIVARADEIPVLVKHLPNWETVQDSATYIVTQERVRDLSGLPPEIASELAFNLGEEAVSAVYGPSRLLIVEHSTPQMATDAEIRLRGRVDAVNASQTQLPLVYRRVGNYSVLVISAADTASANALIDQITYAKTVQWLGENPYPLQQAQQNYTRTMGGVILAVIQGAGLALLICGFIGGIFGALVFLRRRKRQASSTAFSDAGGMLRLNLDEMTPQLDQSRLLEKGDR